MMMRHELKASWSTSLGMSHRFGFHREVSSSLKHSRHVWEYSIPAARTIYFMGIIDILTPYDEMKKFEHRFKACVILLWWSFVLHVFDQWVAAAQQTSKQSSKFGSLTLCMNHFTSFACEWGQVFGTTFQALRHDWHGVSCCPPPFYASRFCSFLEKAWKPKEVYGKVEWVHGLVIQESSILKKPGLPANH